MLSKLDIEKELGKGINILPFNSNNIKENSINLSTSEYAWATENAELFVGNNKVRLFEVNDKKEKKFKIHKGKNCIFEMNGIKKIPLLPFSTTLIQTKEVLGISNYIGGTYHSKVGLVSTGLGHIGTMLGPNFCGHSLIAIHNVTKDFKTIDVGSTFVSVIFHMLKSKVGFSNATRNGHLEKMSEFKIKLTPNERKFLDEDWKIDFEMIKEKFLDEDNYKKYNITLRKRRLKSIFKYFNLKSLLVLLIVLAIFWSLHYFALKADKKLGESTIWLDRYWNVGFSGIFILIAQQFMIFTKKINS